MANEMKWGVHPVSYTDRAYIVPIEHMNRPIGGSSNRTDDRDNYAQQICFVVKDDHGRGEVLRFARLIAAAPELLALLQECRDFFASCSVYDGADTNNLDTRCMDAIAKATGA